MNRYSITSDSRRWWWPSAAAGTAGVAAVAAILVLPATVQASTHPVAPVERDYSVLVDEDRDGQCFLLRAQWNEGLDGVQPQCSHGSGVTSAPVGLPRPRLSYLP